MKTIVIQSINGEELVSSLSRIVIYKADTTPNYDAPYEKEQFRYKVSCDSGGGKPLLMVVDKKEYERIKFLMLEESAEQEQEQETKKIRNAISDLSCTE
jgi:uncharacterized protein involved in type VI secretion and phage assembly